MVDVYIPEGDVNVVDKDKDKGQEHLLEHMLQVLRRIEYHMSLMTDERVTNQDIEDDDGDTQI